LLLANQHGAEEEKPQKTEIGENMITGQKPQRWEGKHSMREEDQGCEEGRFLKNYAGKARFARFQADQLKVQSG